MWVAGTWPNRAPFRRAARWEGVVPLMADDGEIGLCRPDDVRAIVDLVAEHREDMERFDVVATQHWDHSATEYAEAGATWLLQSIDHTPTWREELREAVEQGPARE